MDAFGPKFPTSFHPIHKRDVEEFEMYLRPVITTPPAEDPLDLADIKTFLRIGHDGEDDFLATLMPAAVARLEQISGLVLVSRTYTVTLFEWPKTIREHGLSLWPAPIANLDSVNVVQADNTRTDHTERFRINDTDLSLKPWYTLPYIPRDGYLELVFTAGFGSANDVPDDLKQAVRLLVAQGYAVRGDDNPANDNTLPEIVEHILAPRRELRL